MNKLSIILINRNKGIGRVKLCKILTISTEFLRIEDKNQGESKRKRNQFYRKGIIRINTIKYQGKREEECLVIVII